MSKLIPKFFGSVDDKGKLILERRELFDLFLGSLVNSKVELTVKKFRKSRSLKQNSYYFGVVLQTISEYTGYDVEDLHNHFKYFYLRKPTKIVSYFSTTELSTIEFGEYLDKIIRFVGERLSLNIPTPDSIDNLINF